MRADAGTSLLELLLSMTFLGFIATVTQSWVVAVWRDDRRQQLSTEAAGAVALALDMLVQEGRGAGFSIGSPVTAIAFADATRIELQSDLDGDGSFESSNERIIYAYRTTTRQLTRATGRGTAQPLVEDVAAGGFRLAYFDSGGHVLTPASGGLDSQQRRAVRRIDVGLTVERESDGLTVRHSATTSLSLRNGS